jgi:glycoprotein endo-alpha-1,2-mannosidase
MRRLAVSVLLLAALCVVAVRAAAPKAPITAGPAVTAFYYPWFGSMAVDGGLEHWAQRGHVPPSDIASNFYPSRGLYSTSSAPVLGSQMTELARAGVAQLAVSWWGQGSAEDKRLPAVLAAANARGIAVAAHLEPYGGRTVESTLADVEYLQKAFGIRTFYVYQPFDVPAADWAAANDALRAQGLTTFAQTALVGAASTGRFSGIYTYDVLVYGGDKFARLCAQARAKALLCAPSVGPGFDARRATGDTRVKLRRDGKTYDSMWKAALKAAADVVTITSYNEWQEGTQIEPAAPASRRGGYVYASYDGAWGLRGLAAGNAYLDRTAYWSRVFQQQLAVRK